MRLIRVSRRGGLVVRKPGLRCNLQELEMRYFAGEFSQASLAIGYLCAEQVVMVAIERLAFQILVGAVSDCHRSARQYIFDATAEA